MKVEPDATIGMSQIGGIEMEELAVKQSDLIVLKQLPVIEDRLDEAYLAVQSRLEAMSNLVVTDENYKELKKTRADLNKEFGELESMRKQVKSALEAPYKRFEAGSYKKLADAYKSAIGKLDGDIKEVEGELKTGKQKELLAYWEEYRQSLGLDSAIADPRRSGIKVGLTVSMKSLKMQVREYLDRIYGDIKMIDTLDDADEVLAEYRVCLSVTDAVREVADRHKRIEEERKRREAEEESKKAREEAERVVDEAVKQEEVLVTPTVENLSEEENSGSEKILSTVFRVSGTLSMLKELKAFLVNGGYQFESVKGE